MDEGGDLLRVRVAQVEDLELRAELARRDDAVDDVRDVREVALQLGAVALAVLGDPPAAEDVLRERKVRHVGPADRAVHGEEAKTCGATQPPSRRAPLARADLGRISAPVSFMPWSEWYTWAMFSFDFLVAP